MNLKYSHLSLEERVKIEVFLDHGASLAGAARCIGRHRCTVTREVKRAAVAGMERYIAHFGQRAYARGRKLAGRQRRKLGADLTTPLWRRIISQLRQGYSPQQYAGRMRMAEGSFVPERMRSVLYASHQTIYRGIRELPPSADRAALTRLLRRSTGGRRRRQPSARYTGLQDITPIEQRPREAESRQTLGHWEGDLIKGAGNRSAVGTLVERASRLVLLVPLRSACADDVLRGFTRALRKLPRCARRSLTYDRGSEMARHRELSAALDMPIFFCPPYRPGARATNENTNGLLRQYLPKGTDLSVHTPAQLAAIQRRMNRRPRRILGFQTPQERFDALLAASSTTSH
jgi:IS30 family transposase